MMDVEVWEMINGVLSDADAVRRLGATRGSGGEARDPIGDLHLLLFGDFKQLPPATGKAPFIVMPLVHTFQFRVLRQNRHHFVFLFCRPTPCTNQTQNGVWSKTRRDAERSRTSMKC